MPKPSRPDASSRAATPFRITSQSTAWCVTGFVHPDRILKNVGAQPGDVLVLTKPLGSGVLTTAIKADLISPAARDAVYAHMATLNKKAGNAVRSAKNVHACTDVTGFGLLGHSYEMASGSGVTIRLHGATFPLMDEARDMAEMGIIPTGAYRNMDYVKPPSHGAAHGAAGLPRPRRRPADLGAAFSSRSRARTQSRFFASSRPSPPGAPSSAK